MRTRLGSQRGFRAALCAVPLLATCGAHDPPANVVVVLVDQLRQDAAQRWMPRTYELAARGVVFENMRAVAPWTYPSVISMFSGLYPHQHGADGHPRTGTVLSTFDERVPLLPQRLRAEGFHTVAFVTNPFLQRWNPFHAGFDHYVVDEFIGSQGPLRGFPGAVWRPETMFADTVNRAVRAYFDERPARRPEFTYVHYIDVHGPWEGAPFEGSYETATAYVDGKVRELYDYFLERYDGRLIFVVTSDHGRELGDDLDVGEGQPARKRKATVHDFNTRIPFLILPSALVPIGRVVETPCANIDLLPTVLDWLGFEVPSAIPGRSLLPTIRATGDVDDGRPVYAAMSAFNRASDCIVIHDRKLMRTFDPTTGEVLRRTVFDLATDPRETRPLDLPFGEDGRLLIQAAETGGIEYPRHYEAPDKGTLETLRALGYFGEDG